MQIGLEAVQEVHGELGVEPAWAIYGDNGFAWWPCELRQLIVTEQSQEDDGIEFARVHCRTDFLDNFTGTEEQWDFLGKCMSGATTSGVVIHRGDPRKLQLASTVEVNSENISWTPRFLTLIAIMQACEALRLTSDAAVLAGMTRDISPHPDRGLRTTTDDTIRTAQDQFRAWGDADCPFRGQEFLDVGEFVKQPFTVYTTGDENRLNVEIPFCGHTSLIEQKTTVADPFLGNGLLSTLQTPFASESPIREALGWNTLQVEGSRQGHFVGSWCADRGDYLKFRSFYPNTLCERGLFINLHYSMVATGRWVAESIFGDDWINGGYKKAVEFWEMKGRMIMEELDSGAYLKEGSILYEGLRISKENSEQER